MDRTIPSFTRFLKTFKADLVRLMFDEGTMNSLNSSLEKLDQIIETTKSADQKEVSQENIKKSMKIVKEMEGKIDFPKTRGQLAEEMIEKDICENGVPVDDCATSNRLAYLPKYGAVVSSETGTVSTDKGA